MNGEQTVVTKLVGMNSVQFIIPVYQRNYSWQKTECQQLLGDLVKLMKSDDIRKKHFLGSIVLGKKEVPDGTNYIVIDGQQRLTTIFILLVAIYNLSKEKDGILEEISLSNKIEEDFLINKHADDISRKKRICLLEDDQVAYNNLLVKSEEDFDEKSNVTKNYRFFRNQIINKKLDLRILFDVLRRLELICINLDERDDPQRIFESLNSTGVALEESDKIRNYILMGMSIEEQEECYQKYWLEIKRRLNADRSLMEEFMRHYLSLQFKDNIVDREIYFKFREYAEKVGDNKKLLEELYNYARLYETILRPDDSLPFKDNLVRLNQLGFTVIYPYLLILLNKFKNGILSGDELKEILQVIENYIFRRIIVGLPSQSYNRFFANMEDRVKKKQNKKEGDYVEIVKSLFLSAEKRHRFPSDEEFLSNLMSRDLYNELVSRYRQYLFSRLENGDSKEQTNVIARLENKQYTIEHIMPQTLNSQWKVDLGENYEKIHEKWLHTLPNLTLTAYNSEYSNRSFDEKQNRENGFKDSPLRLNQYIKQCNIWTEKELQERCFQLEERAKKLWKLPMTSYKVDEEEIVVFSIEDVLNSSKKKKLYSYTFLGEEHIASMWKSMFREIVELFRKHDPVRFQTLVDRINDQNADRKTFNWVYPYPRHKGCEEIKEGNYYLYATGNVSEMMKCIQYFLKEYGLDTNAITFNIRRSDDTDTKE